MECGRGRETGRSRPERSASRRRPWSPAGGAREQARGGLLEAPGVRRGWAGRGRAGGGSTCLGAGAGRLLVPPVALPDASREERGHHGRARGTPLLPGLGLQHAAGTAGARAASSATPDCGGPGEGTLGPARARPTRGNFLGDPPPCSADLRTPVGSCGLVTPRARVLPELEVTSVRAPISSS